MSKKKRTRGNIWNSPVHQAKPVEAKVLYSIRGSSFLAPFPLHRSGAASSPPVNQEEKMRDSSGCSGLLLAKQSTFLCFYSNLCFLLQPSCQKIQRLHHTAPVDLLTLLQWLILPPCILTKVA